MRPVKVHNLPDSLTGDTWEGLDIGPITFLDEETGVVTDPPGRLISCRLYFRDSRTNELGYGLKSEPEEGFGTINIIDADTWDINIPQQAIPLPKGTWNWDFETTDIAGTVWTIYKGVQKVLQDVTYD